MRQVANKKWGSFKMCHKTPQLSLQSGEPKTN
jgi:hypothetical protein